MNALPEVIVNTQRTLVVPLKHNYLKLYLEDIPFLERKMGLQSSGYPPEEEVVNAFTPLINILEQQPENFTWFTNWLIVSKLENRIIGGFCFKGIPAPDNSVEIGYGIDLPYRNQGIATEVISGMTAWAFAHPDIKKVRAETDKSNIESQRALYNAGFNLSEEDDFSYWWTNYKNSN